MNKGEPTLIIGYAPANDDRIAKNQQGFVDTLSNIASQVMGKPMIAKADYSKIPQNYGLSRICRGSKTIYISESSGIDTHNLSGHEIDELLESHEDGDIITN